MIRSVPRPDLRLADLGRHQSFCVRPAPCRPARATQPVTCRALSKISPAPQAALAAAKDLRSDKISATKQQKKWLVDARVPEAIWPECLAALKEAELVFQRKLNREIKKNNVQLEKSKDQIEKSYDEVMRGSQELSHAKSLARERFREVAFLRGNVDLRDTITQLEKEQAEFFEMRRKTPRIKIWEKVFSSHPSLLECARRADYRSAPTAAAGIARIAENLNKQMHRGLQAGKIVQSGVHVLESDMLPLQDCYLLECIFRHFNVPVELQLKSRTDLPDGDIEVSG